MSHQPPLPDAAVSTYPAKVQSMPRHDTPEARVEPAAGGATKADADAKKNRDRWVAAGVATGIGSAAILAALLYTNRGRDKKPGK